jgi:hypothetical protein
MKEIYRSSVVQSVALFWELLVAYANADSQFPRRWAKLGGVELVPSHESTFDRIARLLLASGIVVGLPRVDPDFDPDEPGDPGDRTDKIFRTTSNQLKRQHEMFKSTLAWLCSPKKVNARGVREIQRIREASMALIAGRCPMISEEDEKIVCYLEKHGVSSAKRRVAFFRGFHSDRRLFLNSDRWIQAVDPFCAFLVEQCVGMPLKDLPAKLCARRECGRFFVPAKRTRRFCSDNCRAMNFWTPKKRREYMQKWRLGKLPPGVRRRKGSSAVPLG